MFHQQYEYRTVCHELEQFLTDSKFGQDYNCVDECNSSFMQMDFKNATTSCVLSSFGNMLDFRRTVKQTQFSNLDSEIEQRSLDDFEIDCKLRGIQSAVEASNSKAASVDINNSLREKRTILRDSSTQKKSNLKVKTSFNSFDSFDSPLCALSHESQERSFLIHSDEQSLDFLSNQRNGFLSEREKTESISCSIVKEHTVSISPRRVCKPLSKEKIFSKLVKPALKFSPNSLNLFVDSADGKLDEATKYATEINSLNAECIPLPENVNETVTIPAAHAAPHEKKGAIVRAAHPIRFSSMSAQAQGQNQGFYTVHQFQDYLREKGLDETVISKFETKLDNKENMSNRERLGKIKDLNLINLKQHKRGIKKCVTWAINLEW